LSNKRREAPKKLGECTMTWDNAKTYSVPLGRLLLSSLFIYAGFTKLFVFGPEGTAQFFVKAGAPIPEISNWIAIIVELIGGIMILVGLQIRWVALVLAIWCLLTAFGFHLPASAMMHDMNHFYKNLAIAGGLLYVVAYGAGPLSIDHTMGMDKG
jgi:putative oxidoreductase